MTRRRHDTATGCLIIVEAGARIPPDIFSQSECSDHAVVRQSVAESAPDVLERARRCVWEFVASSVRLTDIWVVLNDDSGRADPRAREHLGRSLLEIGRPSAAQLTFLAGEQHGLVTLLGLVGKLIEGTELCSVGLELARGPIPARAFPAVSASAA